MPKNKGEPGERNRGGRPPTGQRKKQIVVRLSQEEFDTLDKLRTLGATDPIPLGRLTRILMLRHAKRVLHRVEEARKLVGELRALIDDDTTSDDLRKKARATIELATNETNNLLIASRMNLGFSPAGDSPYIGMLRTMMDQYGTGAVVSPEELRRRKTDE